MRQPFLLAFFTLGLCAAVPVQQYGNWESTLRTTNPADKVRAVAKTLIDHIPAIAQSLQILSGPVDSQSSKYNAGNPQQMSGPSLAHMLQNMFSGKMVHEDLWKYLAQPQKPILNEYLHGLKTKSQDTPYELVQMVANNEDLKTALREPLEMSPLFKRLLDEAMVKSPGLRVYNAMIHNQPPSLQDMIGAALQVTKYKPGDPAQPNILVDVMANDKEYQKMISMSLDRKSNFDDFLRLITEKTAQKTTNTGDGKYSITVHNEEADEKTKGFAAKLMFDLNNFSKIMHSYEELANPQRNVNTIVNLLTSMDTSAFKAIGKD